MMGHEMDMNKQDTQFFGYEASQDVGGVVTLQIPPGKKLEHLGIKVQFIGRIDMVRDDPNFALLFILILIVCLRLYLPSYSLVNASY